ncbi:MAG: FkbM family methyltransferase [Pseudomonadota bacterium]
MPDILTAELRGERFTLRARTKEQETFWTSLDAGWEEETLAFVEAHAAPGRVFVDIGAWIGPISLLAARKGARVLALEPDPVARAALEENLALNGLKAQILPQALHADAGGLTLYGGRRGLGASTTSALGVSKGDPVHVDTVTAEDVAALAGDAPAFMKVDVEGHEYALGPALAALRARLGGQKDAPEAGAALHLSLHPRQLLKKLRKDWTLFARRRSLEATQALLAQFDGCAMTVSGEGAALTPEALEERFKGARGARNFSVEITGGGTAGAAA